MSDNVFKPRDPSEGGGGLGGPGGPGNPGGPPPAPQALPMNPTARVPEDVVRGVLATNVLVFSSQHEFVVDFVQALAKPPQLAARVVMSPTVFEQFVRLLREVLGKYGAAFGPPAPIPKNPQDRQLSAQEVYSEIKLTDEMLAGTYANAVMANFQAAEFNLDFMTTFYPRSIVGARVQLAAQRIPGLLEAATASYTNWQRQRAATGQGPGPAETPPG